MSDTPITRDPQVQALTATLAAPFDPNEVKWKPGMIKNNRCLAIAYVSARTVMDRLDTVLGVENWEDSYEILPGGSVMCSLRLKFGEQWVSKMDVGSPSEQPDDGDRLKAAVSDALKRAAVKFGISRYLYRLPAQWVDYDPVKKQITQVPQMPAFAIPRANSGTSEGRQAKQTATKEGPAPQPAAQKSLAQQCADAIATAKTRDDLMGIYRQYDADVKEGRFAPAEKADLDAKFKEAGKRFPAPQKAGA